MSESLFERVLKANYKQILTVICERNELGKCMDNDKVSLFVQFIDGKSLNSFIQLIFSLNVLHNILLTLITKKTVWSI